MSGKKILYNGEEYADFSTIAQGVGEFTSNSGVKDPSGSNSEIFNNYYNNVATGEDSHAEGGWTKALGNYSHVEGYKNYSNVLASHTEGYEHSLDSTYILNDGIDYVTLITDINAVSSGDLPTAGTVDIISTSNSAHNEGHHNLVSGEGAHVEGTLNGGFGTGVHIEGKRNIGGGLYTHIEGFNNKNVAYYNDDISFENPEYIWGRNESDQSFSTSAHIEGSNNLNCGDNSHIEGENNRNREGNRAHAEGYNNTLTYAHDSHVEGSSHTLTGTAVAILDNVHVEGVSNTVGAGTTNTHVEGQSNNVNGGSQNHIEGAGHSVTSASYNHVEGYGHIISQNNQYGHVEGCENITNQNVSYYHVGGQGNIVTVNHQTLIGKYGIPGNYAFVIGNGNGTSNRSNALTVDWNGALNAQGVLNTQVDVQINNNSIMTNFAPAYDGTATYPAGSYCTYLGKLYTNPSAITTAEPDFISSHWTEITLSTIQTGNSNSIGSLGTQIGGIWQELGPLTGSTGKVAVLETNVSNHETRITALEQGGSTVDAIVTNSSDEYDTSATYNIGDYCIYNNTLYRCTTAVTAEATFDPDKWEATTIISVLNVLNQRLAALEALPNLDNEPL